MYPVPPEHFRCPNIIVQYINLYLSTILRFIVTSVISSGTPNNIRPPNHITHIIQNRHRTLSMRTLRVRDTFPANNQQRNLNAHLGSYIFYEDLYRSNRNDNIRCYLCHRYVTSRDLIVGIFIPSSILLPASLFTRSVIHHLVTNSLVICLQAYDMYYREGPEKPNIDICQFNKHLRRYL